MSFAVTAAGLLTETQEEIRQRLFTRFKSIFGDDFETADDSTNGQLVDVVSEYMALYQQAALAVHRSFDPAAAIGVSLDQRRALTGSTRIAATKSTVTLQLTFSGAGSVAIGNTIRNVTENTLWDAIEAGAISAAGTMSIRFQCQETGPKAANADSSWAQVTSIPNLTAIANPLAGELGNPVESDEAFRVRAQTEIYAAGQGPLAAITAAVSRATSAFGVTYVRTYHNPRTSPADSDGIPFKAFNVVVITNPNPPLASLQQRIWDAVFGAMGAGGEAGGSISGFATDSEGVSHRVAFDVVVDVLLEIKITLTTSTSEEQVTPNLTAIVAGEVLAQATAKHQTPGRDVRAWDYTGIVYELKAAGKISGIDAVLAEVKATTDSGFTTGKRSIAIRERATFSSTRISVLLS